MTAEPARARDDNAAVTEVGEMNHGYGHRLWDEGERTIARECFRLAALCQLPEAETDVVLLDATGGKHVFECDEFALPAAAPERGRRASRISAARHSWVMIAACVLGAVVVTAPASGWVVARTGVVRTDGLSAESGPAAGTARPAGVRPARALPTIDATLAPVSAATARPARHARSHLPQLQVDLGATSDAKYAVTLSSGAGDRRCSWRIVGSASDRPPGATGIHLRPGETQQVNVSADEWPNLAVFGEPDGGSGQCQVSGLRVVPVEATPTVLAASPAPDPTGTPTPEPTATPTPSAGTEPAPVEATISPPPTPTSEPEPSTS